MENSMKTIVWDGNGRKEIYNHKQTEGFATGINLKPLENFTQEKEYEILEEKTDFSDKLECVISSSFSSSSSLAESEAVDHSIEGAVLLYQRLAVL